MVLAVLLSQGCGKAVDGTGRRAGEGPALPLKKPIYSLDDPAEAQPDKKKPKRPRRRIPGAVLPAKSMEPAKQDVAPRDVAKTPEVIPSDFSWEGGLAMGFAPHPWPHEINSLLIEDPKGLKFQKVVSVDRAVRFSFEADDDDDARHVAGVRIQARHARGLMMDLQVDSQEGRGVQFVSVVVADQSGRRLGRYRSRLAKSKSGASPPRTVQQVKFNPSDPDFELVDDDADLREVHWVEILFQVASKSKASVTLHQFAVLPAPPEPVEFLGRDSFLKVEELPEELGLSQRIAAIQRRVDEHGGDWKTWFESLESERQEIEKQLSDREGPLSTAQGHFFRHLDRIGHVPNESWPGPQIKGLTALDQFLAQHGISLWIVPIPSSEQVFADRFIAQAPEDGRVDVYRDYMLQSLMRQNLNVIDVWPTLRDQGFSLYGASRKDERDLLSPLFYSLQTDALTPRGQRRVARRISESLVRLNLRPDLEELGVTMTELEMPATLTQNQKSDPVDYEWALQVLDSNRTPLATPQSGSQVLLIGDEATVKPPWLRTMGVGLAPYITLDTGLRVQTIVAPRTSPHLIETLIGERKEVLQGKQVCLLVLSEQLLYQNGDSETPIWETTENLGAR